MGHQNRCMIALTIVCSITLVAMAVALLFIYQLQAQLNDVSKEMAEARNDSDLVDRITRMENKIQMLISASTTPVSIPEPTTPEPTTPKPTTPKPTTPKPTTPEPTTPKPTTPKPTTPATTKPGSSKSQYCEELLERGNSTDGVYTIYANGAPIEVYCDMANGGWVFLQKRTDGTVKYDRDFVDYEQGFGDVSGEHWLGLEKMYTLTMDNSTSYVLRIELSHNVGETRWAEYSDFRITAGSDYALTFNETSSRGTLGDDLDSHNNMKFSARDKDMDLRDINCAVSIGKGGGWWYNRCISFVTTGMPYGSIWSIYTYLRRFDEPFTSAIIKIKKA